VTTSGTLTFVIINPVSGPVSRGTAEQRVQLATDALEAVGLRAEIFLTESEGHASDLARHAADYRALLEGLRDAPAAATHPPHHMHAPGGH